MKKQTKLDKEIKKLGEKMAKKYKELEEITKKLIKLKEKRGDLKE